MMPQWLSWVLLGLTAACFVCARVEDVGAMSRW
jgi:hypothetical protein